VVFQAFKKRRRGSSTRPDPASPEPLRRSRRGLESVVTFVLLMAFWILFSGKFDLFHLFLGAVACGIVAHLCSDLLFAGVDFSRIPGVWLRFARYTPWLIYQVFLANIHVLYLVFHPRMKDLIDPRIIQFKSRLKKDMALVTFANSITLTPGTITVFVSIYGDFQVHVIDTVSGEGLPGEMEERIAKVFES